MRQPIDTKEPAVLACPVPVLFRTRISVALSPLKSEKAAICPDRSKRFTLWVTLENCNAITGHMKTAGARRIVLMILTAISNNAQHVGGARYSVGVGSTQIRL